MSAITTDYPELMPLSHGPTWKDGVTGIVVPKTPLENVRQRISLANECRRNPAAVKREIERCTESPLYWFNSYVWTYRVRIIDADGTERRARAEEANVPFITWPVQDHAILTIRNCIETGRDVLEDKSRDMGASWINVALFAHYWLFINESHLMMVSRVEDLVDRRGDPDSLYWKLDYIHAHLPSWMLPKVQIKGRWIASPYAFQRNGDYRSHMHLENPERGCTIDGQATTSHVGRGGRRKAILFDEMAAIQNAQEAWQSAADTTNCRIANSTPIGPGTEFTKQRNRALTEGHPTLVVLGYWNHPEKGRGREKRIDKDGSQTGLAERAYWWTPYFEKQCKRRGSTQDIGQNLLIDHTTSGNLFFNSTSITRHMQTYAHGTRPIRCRIDKERNCFVTDPRGSWLILPGARLKAGVPLKDSNFCMFADIGHGEASSNSTVAIMDRETGRGVAEFADSSIAPWHLADEMVAAGRLFGGSAGEAFMGWEANGPGESFWRLILARKYKYVYFHRIHGQAGKTKTRKYGWRSTRDSKRDMLGALDSALASEQTIIPSQLALEEMLEYIYYADGGIGPGTRQDDTTHAKASHGDRVIAWAGCLLMRGEASKFRAPKIQLPPNSIGRIAGHDQPKISVAVDPYAHHAAATR